jgi:BolA family transcriptional regulator, general stress-responsive regulator
MNEQRVAQIRTKLNDAFAPQRLDIVDDSHKHAGHEGARGGGGHFNVMIVADAFTGQTSVQRHRMIYTALGEELKQAIHALSIKAYTPTEI